MVSPDPGLYQVYEPAGEEPTRRVRCGVPGPRPGELGVVSPDPRPGELGVVSPDPTRRVRCGVPGPQVWCPRTP